MTLQQRIATWLPVARSVYAATGVLPGVLLALGIEETGLGAEGTGLQNNVWGVDFVAGATPPGSWEQAGGFAAYPSPAVAGQDEIRVLSLPIYASVRQARGAEAQIEALAYSDYLGGDAAAHSAFESRLLSVYQANGLAQYDAGLEGAAPSGGAPPSSATLSMNGVTVTGTPASFTVTGSDGTGGAGGAGGALLVVGVILAFLAGAL